MGPVNFSPCDFDIEKARETHVPRNLLHHESCNSGKSTLGIGITVPRRIALLDEAYFGDQARKLNVSL